jgi:hypothetical protein
VRPDRDEEPTAAPVRPGLPLAVRAVQPAVIPGLWLPRKPATNLGVVASSNGRRISAVGAIFSIAATSFARPRSHT